MKRLNNLYDQILSIDNLLMADEIARKGKSKQPGIIEFDKNKDQNIADIYRDLVTNTYKTSEYTIFTVYEKKERIIYRLPYRDRVVHHAIMNVLEPMFVANFTADTYACIKGRGIHAAVESVKNALNDINGTKYCMKLDIRKFYPSIDHSTLKQLLRRKIKDNELLNLLDGIIDSANGLPIGNYLSQYFANFYLSYFDHWLKEVVGVKYYWRYADDLVFLSGSKDELHHLLVKITEYLSVNLKLQVKRNYQIFPVSARGIDFLGYVIYHTHTLLRKSIKVSFARAVARGNRMVNKNNIRASLASYRGWAKHSNSKHLLKKLMPHGFNEDSKIIQRFRHRDHRESLHGRQNQNKEDPESGNTGVGLPDNRFKV
jgi:RNA-directed DNA polymerase